MAFTDLIHQHFWTELKFQVQNINENIGVE